MGKLMELLKKLVAYFNELQGYKEKYEANEAEINEAITLIEETLAKYGK